MDVRSAVLRSLREYDMLAGADVVVCALSGGADSVCLADVLLSLAPELGFRLECAHFNHMLRGAESDRDERFVREWCAGRGIALHTGRGDAAAEAARRRVGLEEAARNLRYGFLESLGDAGTRIATAHQADDQAETVLLNLLRGSGLKGLGGIPPVRGRVIRPLLSVTRAEILDYLRTRGLTFVEDSTNGEPLCARNRIRSELMPVLRELNPAFAEACGRAARLLREDESCLASLAEREMHREEDACVFSAASLSRLPRAVASRAVRLACGEFGVQPEEKHVAAVLSLAASEDPHARIDLPRGLTARRAYDRLALGSSAEESELPAFPPMELEYGAWVHLDVPDADVFWGPRAEAAKIHGKFTTFFFKKSQICGRIHVRPRMAGDYLRLRGRGGKSLKKWMTERKIPPERRYAIPVFSDEEGVLAVPGFGQDVRAAASPEAADAVLMISERT